MSILILLYQPTYSVPCHYKKYKKKDVLKLFVFFFCVWYSIPSLPILNDCYEYFTGVQRMYQSP